MSETQHPRRVLRSIGAVLAGMVAGAALSLGTDELLHVVGIAPPSGELFSDKLLMAATVYRTVYSVGCAYLTARLAPYRPMLHALVGGLIALALGIVGAVLTWHAGPSFGPHWYPVALVVLTMPSAWLGGFLYERGRKNGAATS